MSFSFGFSGDDIEEDPNDAPTTSTNEQNVATGSSDAETLIEARTHELDKMLSTLPSKLSYSILKITSPAGHAASLPRREIFDIRLQLMAEDTLHPTTNTNSNPNLNSNPNANADPLTGLSNTDLQPRIYEGGYKTWECSLDLISFLLDRGPRKDLDDLVRVHHVIELGCGTALPSALLFQYVLRNGLGMNFTLTDYNEAVLRLVTVPNMLLAWVSTLDATAHPFSSEAPNPTAGGDEQEGELEVTPQLVSAFKDTLRSAGIQITLVSGSWVPAERFVGLVPSAPELNTFILASETIYSPSSLAAFTEAMAALLKRVRTGKAVVAAKRVYFGVGGSVDEFRKECSRRGCVAYEVEFEGLESGGVRRCLVEVQMY
ncbi:hypothetical protein CC78DRAFT_571787 [Lojkania enalia]|uniref:protein-histidine N-methyltransferase n=1 Tax=Lojkania enalia TaxID=147567 RepID=A0A9P4K4X5_9PLEO|nr:hypothetical protein CC78DRAFT_571787 [Didymosphaeria enalia]